MTLSTLAWASMPIPPPLLPGVAAATPVGPLRTGERKLVLSREQDDVDSYSPRALSDPREWIRANPDDPYSPIARRRYNECVWLLQATGEPHYDWPDEQIT